RAQRLHRESTVFICHDHPLFPEDFAAMARGGVTAKQLMLSVDARLHAERETFLASIEGRGYAREPKRHERAVGTVDEDTVVRQLSRLGLVVDVSHVAPRAQSDALATATTPVRNSHTGATGLNTTQPQHLDGAVIKAFAALGGVMAILFNSKLVGAGRDKAK